MLTLDFTVERQILESNPEACIVGVDEAGRGPLAGPVSIGYVIWSADQIKGGLPPELRGLNDSKLVKENQRQIYATAIQEYGLACGVIHRSAARIDQLNINQAIAEAVGIIIQRLLRRDWPLSHILIDGNYRFPKLYQKYHEIEFQSIIKGDQKVLSIAAASVLAKTTRDRRMHRYEKYFPGYGLARHKGYGTVAHKEALQKRGPSPIHRRSFKW